MVFAAISASSRKKLEDELARVGDQLSIVLRDHASVNKAKDDLYRERNLLQMVLFNVSYKVTYDDAVEVCKNLIDADPSFEELEDWVCYIFEVINEHFEWPENSDYLWGTTDEDMIRLIFDSLYDVCYEDLCYEDASTIKEAVELIYEMIRDHEYNRGRDLSEWRISKLHRSILLRAYEGETEKLSLENKYN